MNSQILLGILLIAAGAFSAGSFAVPFGKIKGWKWETYWMVYSIGAYVIFPLVACLVFAPGFVNVISSTTSGTIASVFLLGAVDRIGNLAFVLALRYLGLSLGYALSLGLMLAIGTLIPPVLDGRLQAYIFGLLAGLLWFSQFIVYSMGKSKMGPYTFTSWGILMALTIAFSTVWGLIRGEWKGVSVKVISLMILSLVILIISSFMIGISGSM